MNLHTWAERAIKEVSESGTATSRIRMITTDGQTWHSWTAPFGEVDAWVTEAEQVVSELADEWPAQDIQLIFLAETRDSTVISQCTKRLRGRQKGAPPTGLFGGPHEALAKSMDALSTTTRKTLDTANSQLELLNASLTAQVAANQQLMMQLQMMQATQNESRPAVNIDPDLMRQGLDLLPKLLEMFVSDNPPRPPSPGPTNGAPKPK